MFLNFFVHNYQTLELLRGPYTVHVVPYFLLFLKNSNQYLWNGVQIKSKVFVDLVIKINAKSVLDVSTLQQSFSSSVFKITIEQSKRC